MILNPFSLSSTKTTVAAGGGTKNVLPEANYYLLINIRRSSIRAKNDRKESHRSAEMHSHSQLL